MTSTKLATAEEVWALIRENAEGMKELRKAQQRTEEARREGEQALREAHLQIQKEVQQTQKEVRELNQSLKEGGGNFNNKWGHFLENLLEDDLVKLLNEQNIKVEEVFPRPIVKKSGVVTGEYDLAAFKSRVSAYKDKTIYGGIAYMSLKDPEKDNSKDFPQYKNAFEMAQENGLFLIQSPGGAKDVSKIVNKEGFKPKEF